VFARLIPSLTKDVSHAPIFLDQCFSLFSAAHSHRACPHRYADPILFAENVLGPYVGALKSHTTISGTPRTAAFNLLLRRHEILYHCLAHQIRRQQSLIQDEVVELLLIELRS
jgi:hypothetical protein